MTSQKRVLDYCVWYLKFGSMIRLISTHLYVGGSGLGGHTQPLKLANADIIGLAVHDCTQISSMCVGTNKTGKQTVA